MKKLEQPSPISARAAINPVPVCAMANSRLPARAIAALTISVARAPYRSMAMPTGICARAKLRKKADERKPSRLASRASSRARSGPITPMALRWNWLII